MDDDALIRGRIDQLKKGLSLDGEFHLRGFCYPKASEPPAQPWRDHHPGYDSSYFGRLPGGFRRLASSWSRRDAVQRDGERRRELRPGSHLPFPLPPEKEGRTDGPADRNAVAEIICESKNYPYLCALKKAQGFLVQWGLPSGQTE